MKRNVLGFLMIAILIALAAGAASAATGKTFMSIATGGTSGTYYPIGGAIAQAVSKGAPDLQVTAETGNASVANLNLIGTHGIEVAFTQNDTLFWAVNGKMMFKAPFKNIKVIAALYPEHVHLVALKGNGVSNIDALKGKKVSVGAPGSGVEGDVRAILQSAGLKYSDMKTDFLDFGATTQRFKDNQIDAGFVVAGYPVASIMDLSTTKAIDLVDFSDAYMAKLTKDFPYFVKSSIPAGTYKGVDKAVTTPAVMALLVVDGDLADDVVYKFTKAMWDNIDDVHKSHAKGRLITLNTALEGLTAPLHPGAAKFYKEKGLKLPK